MDYKELSVDELQDIVNDAQKEIDRRALIDGAAERIDKIIRDSSAASGRVNGDEWVQPTGYENVYPAGWEVTHNGKTWVSNISGNFLEPGVSGWTQEIEEGEQPPDFKQPVGYQDVYNEGDLVTFQDDIYKCTVDGTAWSPLEAPANWEKQQ